jgi:dolichyl-phosphate beta-glucosyltransferase
MAFLSVVIPAYNEALAIQHGKLQKVADWLAAQKYAVELIVVDDGSQDATAELARPIAQQVLSIPHAGKAAAIVAGIRAAGGQVVLSTDMDQATPITETPKLLDALESADLAIGSRGLVRRGAPLGRYVLSWGQVALRALVLGLLIADTQCGFKACKREAVAKIIDGLRVYHPDRLKSIQGPSVTSGFDVETLYVARRFGLKIQEVPVAWNYQETRRVSLAKDAWRGIRDLLAIRLADLKGEYSRAPASRQPTP